jgi:choline dehydrogenase-like flavoprotein
MGHDPEHSVVDRFGSVHGVPNLFLADASVLVTQGAGDSPSLTIQGLALRAAETLAARARRGGLRKSA